MLGVMVDQTVLREAAPGAIKWARWQELSVSHQVKQSRSMLEAEAPMAFRALIAVVTQVEATTFLAAMTAAMVVGQVVLARRALVVAVVPQPFLMSMAHVSYQQAAVVVEEVIIIASKARRTLELESQIVSPVVLMLRAPTAMVVAQAAAVVELSEANAEP